jgi:lysophospholipase L1-like esterase
MARRSILCFGDSNTHGTLAMRDLTDRRRLDTPDRWTSVMAQTLGADWDVVAEGHPGRTTVYEDPIEGAHKCGLSVLQPLLESHRPLDLVIVMLGTNDLKARFGQSAYEISLGVQRIALTIRASDCGPDGQAPQVLISAPVYALETGCLAQVFAGGAEKSAQLPDCLAAVARTHGFGFVDLNDVAQVDPVDGIHLDLAAHSAIGARMAQAVLDFIT